MKMNFAVMSVLLLQGHKGHVVHHIRREKDRNACIGQPFGQRSPGVLVSAWPVSSSAAFQKFTRQGAHEGNHLTFQRIAQQDPCHCMVTNHNV